VSEDRVRVQILAAAIAGISGAKPAFGDPVDETAS
jgi:hypothetical protein